MNQMPEPISFATLQGAACGYREASEILVDFIYRRVATILRPDCPDVGEATTDTYMKVIKAVREDAFDTVRETKPASWVAKIAVHVAIDYRRRTQRYVHRFESFDYDLSEPADPAWKDPNIAIDEGRRGEIVQALLSRIDEDHRAVILLRYCHDLSYEEIAQALDIPVGTVKSRIHRTEAQLRSAATRTRIGSESGLRRRS